MDKLAQELVDQLIDALYVADPDSMKAPGLVCTHWVARSRYNFFTQVSVSATRLLPFVEIVSSCSLPILTFLRNLHLQYDGEPGWLWNLDWIQPCPNLCAFEIRVGVQVEDLEPLCPHIRSRAESGSVSELRLIGHDISLPQILNIISCVPSVTSLHLEVFGCTLGPTGDGGNEFFPWLLSFRVVPRLRSFKYSGFIPSRHEAMQQYFVLAGGNLHSLKFDLQWRPTDLSFNMGAIYRDIVPHTPNLRHLSLCFRDHSVLLETLALLHAPNLKSLTISRMHNLPAFDESLNLAAIQPLSPNTRPQPKLMVFTRIPKSFLSSGFYPQRHSTLS
ncbi:hypothetical protein DFH08DRAFT_946098 [Mycena albidolilacea]|uniref:Uncharacterized protein n=1 Tax=Mycena albidolilacea TaxID=1033008 RepID=A0AAD6YY26_9AGAR|nr:hypothetical protein DFH08DRAFT_946098 [Mycena albidolilacea]